MDSTESGSGLAKKTVDLLIFTAMPKWGQTILEKLPCVTPHTMGQSPGIREYIGVI